MTTQKANNKLKVSQVSKYYGDLCALDKVDLYVDEGEFVALLGPNGAGKSTLFQLLTGLFVPDNGDILINQQSLSGNATQALASLGVVFQQITLDLDLTVMRNLLFHCGLHGIARPKKRIHLALQRGGLLSSASKPCRALSGGNRRKVELARSLLHYPSILLMDEPTVGLDPASRESLVAYVRSLCRDEGLAVLWATHLVDEADDADRVYILDKGRVLQQGSPETIVASAGASDLLSAFLKMTTEKGQSKNA
ncbi:MAG: ATP-binding cassette domain-containing protein [Gammaproteobacteria bacterium]|nr:ATP-binding cassette domain-containing protein [Gammaproteobacteria bacterium]